MALSVDIEKRLGEFHLRLAFQAGSEVLALLGASGCGKSMTLKCIAGIEKPDAGRIVLDGRVLFDSDRHINLPPQKRKVGYLFQQYALFPNMTVSQNIAAGLRARKGGREEIGEAIAALGLSGCEDKRPHQLSGGQQQRVALARILVNQPDVLLLDEPFSALDSHLRFRLEQEVSAVMRRFGKTVLLVSHDRDEVYRLSDRVAIVHDGRIETLGGNREVFRRPGTRSGAVLTGCKNISPIRRLDARRVLALDWDMELELAEDAGEAAYVGVRMHDIRPAPPGGEGPNRFACRVAKEIENPFSFTVMLRREGCAHAPCVGWEMEKDQWNALRGERVDIQIPPASILLLKES